MQYWILYGVFTVILAITHIWQVNLLELFWCVVFVCDSSDSVTLFFCT